MVMIFSISKFIYRDAKFWSGEELELFCSHPGRINDFVVEYLPLPNCHWSFVQTGTNCTLLRTIVYPVDRRI